MDSNKVLVMDHGKAIEFDHPYVLLKNEQGHFTSMVKETGKLMFEQLKKIAEEAYNSVCTNVELQSPPQIHNGETVKDN